MEKQKLPRSAIFGENRFGIGMVQGPKVTEDCGLYIHVDDFDLYKAMQLNLNGQEFQTFCTKFTDLFPQVFRSQSIMRATCQNANVPYEAFEFAVALQYRALRNENREHFDMIDAACDKFEADVKAGLVPGMEPQL